MKKYIFILTLLISASAQAQQVAQYSQYIWNSFLINPAITGAENYLDIKAGYRNQWVGLPGAPKTMYLTIHGQRGKKLINREDQDVISRKRNSQAPSRLSQALGFKKRKFPTAPASFKVRPHHGFGGQIMNDRIGPFNTIGLYGSYAYHIPLAREVYISAGAFFGVKQYTIDINKITLTTQDDPAIGAGLRGMTPDGMVGVMAYGPKFYVGASMNQVFDNKIKFEDNIGQMLSKATLAPHYFLMGGYRVKLNEQFAVVPSTIVRYLPGTNPAVDLTAKFNYMDVIWAGASWRATDAVIFLLGLSFQNKYDIGYSYDFTTSKLGNFNKGTHEIVVGFRLVNKASTGCKPSYVW